MADDLDNAAAIWGNLLTSSQMKELGLNKDKDSPQQAKRQKRKEPHKRSPPSSDTSQTQELIQSMAKLLLRHEDSLHVLLQEHELYYTSAQARGPFCPFCCRRASSGSNRGLNKAYAKPWPWR